MGSQLYVLSGCSGGGKSSLLAELARRGFRTVEEPGRVIVREEQETGGDALPWGNPEAFAARAIKMSIASFDVAAQQEGPIFFDRSFVDAISFLGHLKGAISEEHSNLLRERRYTETVFLTPPWPEIFENDAERQLSFDVAVEEYERLLQSYSEFGYSPIVLPAASIDERAAFVMSFLQS